MKLRLSLGRVEESLTEAPFSYKVRYIVPLLLPWYAKLGELRLHAKAVTNCSLRAIT